MNKFGTGRAVSKRNKDVRQQQIKNIAQPNGNHKEAVDGSLLGDNLEVRICSA